MQPQFEPLMNDRPVRIGVIGLGGGAQIIHLPLLSETEDVEVVGVCDTDAYKTGRIADKYNVPGFVDAANLLSKTRPDAVIVCTPPISHLPLALAAMENGSHVIVEKPVTRGYEEAKRLADAAAQYKKLALVAMNIRFRQDVVVLRNFLRSEELGKVWRVRAGWLQQKGKSKRSEWLHQKNISGGGVLMDLGIQLIDVIHWLTGNPRPLRVTAFAQNAGLGHEVEDTFTSTVEYENGLTVHYDCSWGLLAEKGVAYTYVEGTKGSAKLDPLEIVKTIQGELVNVSPVKSSANIDLYKASFRAQLHHITQTLRGEVEPISTIEEALDVMRLVRWMYQSAHERREIIPNGD